MEDLSVVCDVTTKYFRWYVGLIESRLSLSDNRKVDKNENGVYYEKHHIVPKFCGGVEVVYLTPREHYIAHMLLVKCCKREHKKSMVYAFMAMRRSPPGDGRSPAMCSRLYDRQKRLVATTSSGENNYFYGKRFYGKDNPFSGKHHTEESKRKNRESHVGKQVGEDNPFFGKKHKSETRELISKKKKEFYEKHGSPIKGVKRPRVQCSCGKNVADSIWARKHKPKGHTGEYVETRE